MHGAKGEGHARSFPRLGVGEVVYQDLKALEEPLVLTETITPRLFFKRKENMLVPVNPKIEIKKDGITVGKVSYYAYKYKDTPYLGILIQYSYDKVPLFSSKLLTETLKKTNAKVSRLFGISVKYKVATKSNGEKIINLKIPATREGVIFTIMLFKELIERRDNLSIEEYLLYKALLDFPPSLIYFPNERKGITFWLYGLPYGAKIVFPFYESLSRDGIKIDQIDKDKIKEKITNFLKSKGIDVKEEILEKQLKAIDYFLITGSLAVSTPTGGGKTLLAIALAIALQQLGEVKRIVVITRGRTTADNWKIKYSELFPIEAVTFSKLVNLYKELQKAGVQNPAEEIAKRFGLDKSLVVLDEAHHFLAMAKSQKITYQVVREILKYAKYKLILSASLLVVTRTSIDDFNYNFAEILTLLELFNVEAFKEYTRKDGRLYCIEASNITPFTRFAKISQVSEWVEAHHTIRKHLAEEFIKRFLPNKLSALNEENKNIVAKVLLNSLLISVTKSFIYAYPYKMPKIKMELEIVPFEDSQEFRKRFVDMFEELKEILEVYVPLNRKRDAGYRLSEAESQKYRKYYSELVKWLSKMKTMLAKYTLGIDPSSGSINTKHPKIRHLINTLKSWLEQYNFVIVASYYAKLDNLAHLLREELKVPVLLLTGSDSKRVEKIEEFKRKFTKGVIILTSATSESIDLPEADAIYFFSIDFSYRMVMQFIGRLTRVSNPKSEARGMLSVAVPENLLKALEEFKRARKLTSYDYWAYYIALDKKTTLEKLLSKTKKEQVAEDVYQVMEALGSDGNGAVKTVLELYKSGELAKLLMEFEENQ